MNIKISNGVPSQIPADGSNSILFYPLSLNLFNDFTQSDINTWSDDAPQPDVLALLNARSIDVKNIKSSEVVSYAQGKQIQVTLANDQVVVFDYQKASEDANEFQLKKVYASHDTLANQLARQPLPDPPNLKGLVKVPMESLSRFFPDQSIFSKNDNGQFILKLGTKKPDASEQSVLIGDLHRSHVVIDGERCIKNLPEKFADRYHPEFYQQAMNGMLGYLLMKGFAQTRLNSGLSMARAFNGDSATNYYTENGVSHCMVLERNYSITNYFNKETEVFIPGYIVFDYQTTANGYIVNAYASHDMKLFLDAYYVEQERISLIDESGTDRDQAYQKLATHASNLQVILIDINNLKTTITKELAQLRTFDENPNNFMETGIMNIGTAHADIDVDFSNLIDECVDHAQELITQGKPELALEYLTQIKTMCTILGEGLTKKTPPTDVRQKLVESYNTFKQTTCGKHDERNILKFLLKIFQMFSAYLSSDASSTASQQTPTYLLNNRQKTLGKIIDNLPEPPTFKA